MLARSITNILTHKINSVLLEVDRILEKYPELALERHHVTCGSEKELYAPLEAAYWTRYPIMYELVRAHAKRAVNGSTLAMQMLYQMEAKTYRVLGVLDNSPFLALLDTKCFVSLIFIKIGA